MTRLRGGRAGRILPVLLAAAAALAVAAPTVLGFSEGIVKDSPGVPPDFEALGCTACHGPGPSGHHDFAAGGNERVSWQIVDSEGAALAGNVYEPDQTYTITITLNETAGTDQANRAGFNLRAASGSLAAVAGQTEVSGDGTQATHTGPERTSWEVQWTAPASGPAIFDLFVNDVDGNRAPNAGDKVYRIGFYLLDESHALPGAAAEHEVHYGISLQQYWIGLIGLSGMLFIILASFVYLKFVSPHNTDQKDR